MRWAVLGFVLGGAAFLFAGWRISQFEKGDTALSAVIPTIIGMACWAMAFVLLVTWGVVTLLPSRP